MYTALLRTINDFDIQSAPDHLGSVVSLPQTDLPPRWIMNFIYALSPWFPHLSIWACLRNSGIISRFRIRCEENLALIGGRAPKRRLAKRMAITVHIKHRYVHQHQPTKCSRKLSWLYRSISESQEGPLQILALVGEPWQHWHEALVPHLRKSGVQSALQVSGTRPIWFKFRYQSPASLSWNALIVNGRDGNHINVTESLLRT
ncbi:hypothetical protein EV401DRAFT_1308415 [Pisolithus croceorrhizus]|nr:hypothetical protein EV401DRAFT_1308415 [Pisolithus croceorrhizus]